MCNFKKCKQRIAFPFACASLLVCREIREVIEFVLPSCENKAMPRYVILCHELPAASGRNSHWDLLLEQGGALRTWALDELPAGQTPANALALADHRLAYLDYEGPVSGNRGHVTRYDRGEYERLQESDDLLAVALAGERFQGTLTLVRTAGERWQAEYRASPHPS